MASPPIYSLLLLFFFSALSLQSADALRRPINDHLDRLNSVHPRNRIASRRPKPGSERYYSNRGTSSAPNRYILAENTTKTNHTAITNSTSNSTSISNSNSTSHTNSTTNSNSNSTSTHHHFTRRKIRNWIIGFIVGSLSGVISALIVSVFFRFLLNVIRGRYRCQSGPSIYIPKIIKRAEDLAFLEKEEGIASLEIIGRGGSGEVYKAQLPGNPPRTIAIKKIMKRVLGGPDPSDEETKLLDKWMRQIKSEIKTVGYIRHKNLLPLVAHVSRSDCHYLIYEFMKNGSLLDALTEAKEGRRELDWPARLRIADGIATGLEYLHVNHKPQIIHRDLKPANILLDDDMEARIADFGLAKEMPDANTHVSSSNVAGTLGYIAPEYHQTLKFTPKCDIYSFGVILAVLVIGKQPIDDFFQTTEEIGLVNWLRNMMQFDSLQEAIDPALIGNGFEEQMKLVLRIACFCTSDDPKGRPTSRDVKSMLSQIKR